MAQSVQSCVSHSILPQKIAVLVQDERRLGFPTPTFAGKVRNLRKKASQDEPNLAVVTQCRLPLFGGTEKNHSKGNSFCAERINLGLLTKRLAASGIAECNKQSDHDDHENDVTQLREASGEEDVTDGGLATSPSPSLLAWFDKMSQAKLTSEIAAGSSFRRQRGQEQPFLSRRHFAMSMPAFALSWSLLPSMQQQATVSVPTAGAFSSPVVEEKVVSVWQSSRLIFEGPAVGSVPKEAWVEWDWLLRGPVASAVVDEERVAFDEERLLEQNRRIQQLNNAPEGFPGFIRKKFEVKVVATENYVATNTGLLYLDISQGSGTLPMDGQEVVFHYTGYNESGRRVDSSYLQGQPARTRVGINGMIPGFEEGIKTMKVGGKRRIVVPPELGPPTGPGTFFSAKQYEVFDVELLAVRNCERRTIAFFSDVQCSDV